MAFHGGYTFWPLVYLPLLGLVGWLVLRTARSIDPTTGRYLVTGLACLATAVVLEASAPALYALGSDRGQPLYELEVTVEEALETTGWGLLALGLLAAAVDLLLARGAALLPSHAAHLPRGPGDGPPSRARTGSRTRQGSSDAVLRPEAKMASHDVLLHRAERRGGGDRRRRRTGPLET